MKNLNERTLYRIEELNNKIAAHFQQIEYFRDQLRTVEQALQKRALENLIHNYELKIIDNYEELYELYELDFTKENFLCK